MTSIIDRREERNRSAPNRKKFLERYKQSIKDGLKKAVAKRSITDMKSGRTIPVDLGDGISEPYIGKDPKSGRSSRVLTGNKKEAHRGDRLPRPRGGSGNGGSGNGEGEDDNFSFTLTREEFMELFFEDLELPNFIKETISKSTKVKYARAGWKNEGVPPQLDIKKTYMQFFMRTVGSDDPLDWIEEVDLKYRQYTPHIVPDKTAVMIFLMDTSGSMDENLQYLCKQFFLLMLLFLEQNYDNVTCEFIRYTENAKLCDEDEFFNSHESGGTDVFKAVELLNHVIKEKYPVEENNIYVAHGCDGETWGDYDALFHEIKAVLATVNYYAYLHVGPNNPESEPVTKLMKRLEKSHNNLGTAVARKDDNECYEALRKLFGPEDRK